MGRYYKAKIFKIVSTSTNKIFVGFTKKTLNYALNMYKNQWRRNPNEMQAHLRELFENGGKVTAVLIENRNYNSRREVIERKKMWIQAYILGGYKIANHI